MEAFSLQNPECDDLLQGPMLYDDLQSISTHLEPEWREQFWGTWATDPRVSRAVVVGIAASVAAGAVWKVVHAAPAARWLLVGGVAIGLAIVATQ